VDREAYLSFWNWGSWERKLAGQVFDKMSERRSAKVLFLFYCPYLFQILLRDHWTPVLLVEWERRVSGHLCWPRPATSFFARATLALEKKRDTNFKKRSSSSLRHSPSVFLLIFFFISVKQRNCKS
jgi:hypothetical protein